MKRIRDSVSRHAPPMRMLSLPVSSAASTYLSNMHALPFIERVGTEALTMHRGPFGASNVNMIAGGQPSGPRDFSESTVPHASEKKVITEPDLRKDQAGSATLFFHTSSNSCLSSGKMAPGSTMSLSMMVVNARLTMIAPDSKAL